VTQVSFSDVKAGVKNWWPVVESSKVDLCLDDPGFEVPQGLFSRGRFGDTGKKSLAELSDGN
jgi:hypothetical protein